MRSFAFNAGFALTGCSLLALIAAPIWLMPKGNVDFPCERSLA
jgi:hypothetical protein